MTNKFHDELAFIPQYQPVMQHCCRRNDMETQVRPMTPDEYKQGHAPCHCGEFTHIFRQCAMQRLPHDYSGELCPRCSLWMCKTDKLAPLVDGAA